MFAHEKVALSRVAARIREALGERVEAIIAFGSRVRGDHSEWSDLDLLVVVRARTPEVEGELVSIVVEEEMRSGVLVSPVIKDAAAFERERQARAPFYRNVLREGMVL